MKKHIITFSKVVIGVFLSASFLAILVMSLGNNTNLLTAVVTNYTPKGSFDVASCDVLQGWTCDQNNYAQALAVHFYDGKPGYGGVLVANTTANLNREIQVGGLCGGYTAHGFSAQTPTSLRNNLYHSIYAYAINIPSGSNPQLGLSPKTIRCTSSTPVPSIRPTPTSPITITKVELFDQYGSTVITPTNNINNTGSWANARITFRNNTASAFNNVGLRIPIVQGNAQRGPISYLINCNGNPTAGLVPAYTTCVASLYKVYARNSYPGTGTLTAGVAEGFVYLEQPGPISVAPVYKFKINLIGLPTPVPSIRPTPALPVTITRVDLYDKSLNAVVTPTININDSNSWANAWVTIRNNTEIALSNVGLRIVLVQGKTRRGPISYLINCGGNPSGLIPANANCVAQMYKVFARNSYPGEGILIAGAAEGFVYLEQPGPISVAPVYKFKINLAPPPDDITPPVASITSPASGANYSAGQRVIISANATDIGGISRVVFSGGSSIFGPDQTDNFYPYSVSITIPSNPAVGQHCVFATAYDTSENSTFVGPRCFNVVAAPTSVPYPNFVIGDRVKSIVNLSGVPVGSFGTVLGGPSGFTRPFSWDVQWDIGQRAYYPEGDGTNFYYLKVSP